MMTTTFRIPSAIILVNPVLDDRVSTCLKQLNLSTTIELCTDETIMNCQARLVYSSDEPPTVLKSPSAICRLLCSTCNSSLYRSFEDCQSVDSWLALCEWTCAEDRARRLRAFIKLLKGIIEENEYVCGSNPTLADIFVHSMLSKQPTELLSDKVTQYMDDLNGMFKEKKTPNPSISIKPDHGRFLELPNAEMGKVVVRFPPEASGYLHVGHVKAALLNQFYKEKYDGRLILRFDDTNPEKETSEFENAILDDCKNLLQLRVNQSTRTSDHFERLISACTNLITAGKAYCDDTESGEMKRQREQKTKSRCRDTSVETNLAIWSRMQQGKAPTYCVRAKIDYESPNGCMRDPTIFRCKNEPHVIWKERFKVYPTYDFACPLVDSWEGVTHALRTTEYHDRDEQYDWVLESLKQRKVHICEFSRLNLQSTVLSKRKLAWFVSSNKVTGWNDPRMPTLRGVFRRGMTLDGLRAFIESQGSSKSNVNMEWDKVWAMNTRVIDPHAKRYTALLARHVVKACVRNVSSVAKRTVQLHPKDASVGTKQIYTGPNILLDGDDVMELSCGDRVTLIGWGNMRVNSIVRHDDRVDCLILDAELENTDFKKTKKINWLCMASMLRSTAIPVVCVYFDHLISKPKLAPDDDFKEYAKHKTRFEFSMTGELAMKNIEKGEIIQLQRRGYFICEQPYMQATAASGLKSPCVLYNIPDGTTKESPTSLMTVRKKFSRQSSHNPLSSTCIHMALKEDDSVLGLLREDPKQAKKSVFHIDDLDRLIKEQGDAVRRLKSEKKSKEEIDVEVKKLLDLKAQYKEAFKKDWQPAQNSKKKSGEKSAVTRQSVTSSCQSADDLDKSIKEQGDLVRHLKSEKKSKEEVDVEVRKLLELKAQYKGVCGKDWQPSQSPKKIKSDDKAASAKSDVQLTDDLDKSIKEQGDTVRKLKSEKKPKIEIDPQVKKLLELKANYKEMTGKDWQPSHNIQKDNKPGSPQSSLLEKDSRNTVLDMAVLDKSIKTQGDAVRKLKVEKKPKDEIKIEVQKLLDLKAQYRAVTGKDWEPNEGDLQTKSDADSSNKKTDTVSNGNADELNKCIKEQGDIVRMLKAEKKQKGLIDQEVQKLLELKAKFKNVSGKDCQCVVNPKSTKIEQNRLKSAPKPDSKKQTRLCIEAKKEEDLSSWYSEVLTKAEMIEYYDVSGCYIMRPWSFSIWEKIRNYLDDRFRTLDVQNAYFPLFVSKSALHKEETHIEDFAPEVAWVTRSGSSDLAEAIAVRPTSETIMYPAYANWIKSYRDLPLKINQWNNVVRWEFKHPTPFLRSREFLWQEGHTAYLNKEDACEETRQILDFYAEVYESLLAVPVVKGRKSNKEKFAGAEYSLTIEGFIPSSGRGIQAATSHHLGRNFSKMFDIKCENPVSGEMEFVYQNSWGITTRTIGVMVMLHADNKGLILPPRIAYYQVVVVPCGLKASTSQEDENRLLSYCREITETLRSSNVRVHLDNRSHVSPGWKFNHWELMGVPLRLEIGFSELQTNKVCAVRRDSGEKFDVQRNDEFANLVKNTLDRIHDQMLAKCRNERESKTLTVNVWSEFVDGLKRRCVLLAPFCGKDECEVKIKERSAVDAADESEQGPQMGAKSLCFPFDAPDMSTLPCINCGTKDNIKCCLFGRSY
ncbi:hypothetical protein ACOME3_000841 [Neoechinorhynchus agilis]